GGGGGGVRGVGAWRVEGRGSSGVVARVSVSGPEARMAKEFFDRDMQLFIDHRFDWTRYFALRRGDGVQVADEVATFKEVLRTTGEICESIAEGRPRHWNEWGQMADGEVLVPTA